MIISCSVLYRIRCVLGESCRENENTHFMFSNFLSKRHAIYERMWKNIVEPDRPHENIKRQMRIACLITKVTSTHLEYVILIAFLLQQLLQERASMLRYMYIACCVVSNQLPTAPTRKYQTGLKTLTLFDNKMVPSLEYSSALLILVACWDSTFCFARFMEAVQGKELERIFREEGVIDEDEPEEEEEDEIEEKGTIGDHDGNDGKSGFKFDIHMSMHHKYIPKLQPTRCNIS